MENQIKNYFDYLFYIGVTSESTSSVIIQLLTNKYNNCQSINEDDLLISLTCDYFKLLTEEQLSLIGKNIYKLYLKNKLSIKLKYLNKLIIIKNHFSKRELKRYFNKWRLKTINLTTITNNDYKINYIHKMNSYSNLSISSNFLDKVNYYNERKNNMMKNLKNISEYNISKNYTFYPNAQEGKIKNNKEIHNILYADSQKRDIALQELTRKIKNEEGFTFRPTIDLNNKYIKNIKGNFDERNKKMLERKGVLSGSIKEKKNNNKSVQNFLKSSKKSSSSKKK